MRAIDIGRMALKRCGRWMIAPLALIVIAAVCLCYAGAIGVSVGTEKQMPCELTVTGSADGEITDQALADIAQIPDVTAVTAVLPVQVILKTGRYAADVTLLGVDGRYLQKESAAGAVFPDTSVMPYIVLNDAAEKLFIEPKDPPSPADTDYVPDIDWLHTDIALYAGDDTEPVTSKVCGILTGYSDALDAAGYISIATAKVLMKNHDIPMDHPYALVRAKDMGAAKDVTRKVRSLGYAAEDADPELQAKWDGQAKEMTYLLWMGGICLIWAALLIAAVLGTGIAGQRNELIMLRWMGMGEPMIRRMYIWQSAMIGIAGAVLGILVSYIIIPAFIPLKQRAISIFALPLPSFLGLAVGVLCIGVSILPGILKKAIR